MLTLQLVFLWAAARVFAAPQMTEQRRACGQALYYPSKYTCYDTDFLCPVIIGNPTLRCGPDCYSTAMYSCSNGKLVYPPSSTGPSAGPSVLQNTSAPPAAPTRDCAGSPKRLQLSDPPYENYFYSDCNSAGQIVVTSPLPDSNLSFIGPRLLVAWPAGNSGVVAFFAPQNGVNGSLSLELVNGTTGQPLSGIFDFANATSLTGNAKVGVSTLLSLNSSATLNLPILGSIRTIRDFTEGPSILVPLVQDAITFEEAANGGVLLSRLWLDNQTTTVMSFVPANDGSAASVNNRTVHLEAGTYNFTASFDYPQLTQLSAEEVFNQQSQGLISQSPDQTQSLSFLSYSEKLLAGAWRFLTYFGRDSMISLLLMQPILSEGDGGAIEAAIGAVLERINRTDGSVCHEETIGDYATYLNLQDNITSTAPVYDYKMIDTDFFLPIVMERYFIESAVGQDRSSDFFRTLATVDPANANLTYADLARISSEKIMDITSAFAQPGGQVQSNLMHLKEGQVVGQWRDSTYGIGGGRIPYDVNTALVPAALRSIAALSAAGFFTKHPAWNTTATNYAQVWEDGTLDFFAVTVPAVEARALVEDYTNEAGYGFPSNAGNITSTIQYHGLSLEGNNNQSLVKVMNTDDCFRHFLLNTTNQAQLTAFVNQTANNIRAPYPVGLSTPVGLIVANPAYGGDPVYAANFTNNAYHGTVVWSWQLAMMAAGLERQIVRCGDYQPPDFCADDEVRTNVLAAYNHLWDLIEDNSEDLSQEVWSWVYNDGFEFVPLGALPPPAGSSPTESNIRQLWSLTFLAVRRNEALK